MKTLFILLIKLIFCLLLASCSSSGKTTSTTTESPLASHRQPILLRWSANLNWLSVAMTSFKFSLIKNV